MTNDEIIDKLREDEHYYGEFGKQFLSNSDISTLLKNPLALGQQRDMNPAFLVGGYFHTAILEPDKLKNYKVIEASTRNTKKYKEISGGEMCLLQHEVDQIEVLIDKVMANDVCKGLIQPGKYEYEKPGITNINGVKWKGKADVINHDDKLIIDLKTTSDIYSFKWSAKKYNYDSQAYLYQQMFGKPLVFYVVCKSTGLLGVFEPSPEFIEGGESKVAQAIEVYRKFYGESPSEDIDAYFINEIL